MPLRPLIIIDGFDAGILEDATIQARNGFSYCAGIDIHKEPGILKVSNALSAMRQAASPDNITDPPKWIVKYGDYYYVLGDTGRIYNNSADWILVHTDTNSGKGQSMITFNGNLHWMGDTTMGKFDGTTWTDSFKTGFTSTSYHPMVIFGDKLMIGNERYVATLDTSDTLTLQALDLPAGYIIRDLAVYGNKLMIVACKFGETISMTFSWNGTDPSFEQIWEIKEPHVFAIKNWGNLLVLFGGEGNIYLFNGATVTKLPKKIPFYPEFTQTIFVRSGAITEISGNLVFGYGVGVFNYGGVYTIANESGYPLTISHIPSPGQTGIQPMSIYNAGAEQFLLGWKSGSTYGIDSININGKVVSTAYWESQKYEVAIADNPIPVKGVELIAKPMASGTSVEVAYKKDNASSWTTLGTINSTNQSRVLLGIIGLAKTIQIRLNFTCAGNNTPEILSIKIY